jgi:hypothetical protein
MKHTSATIAVVINHALCISAAPSVSLDRCLLPTPQALFLDFVCPKLRRDARKKQQGIPQITQILLF